MTESAIFACLSGTLLGMVTAWLTHVTFPINEESAEAEGDYLKMPDGWAYFSGGVAGVGETKREAKRDFDEQRKNEKVGQDMDRLKKAVRKHKARHRAEEEIREITNEIHEEVRRVYKSREQRLKDAGVLL